MSAKNGFGRKVEHFSTLVTHWTGGTTAFATAAGIVLLWGISGPLFGFSDTWQLVINTGTTIVTFLMVFLIQRSQNKDSKAIQLKLNELVAALGPANNRLIDIEDLDEDELEVLHRFYATLARRSKEEESLTEQLSPEAAETRHRAKARRRTRRRP